MCIIMLGGEDTHPWFATKVGNPIPVTIPVTKKKQPTNYLNQPLCSRPNLFGIRTEETFKKYKGCSGSVSSGLTIGAHFINFLTNITIYRSLYIFKCRICYCSTSSQWAFTTSPYGIMCVQINTTIIMSSEVTPKIFSCLTTHV